MHVILYKRHKADCEHRDDKNYKRCRCAVWMEWRVMMRLRSAEYPLYLLVAVVKAEWPSETPRLKDRGFPER